MDRRPAGSGCFSSSVLLSPIPGQQFVDALGGMIRQPRQHIGKPGLGIDIVELGGGDQRVDRFPFTLTPSRRPSAEGGGVTRLDQRGAAGIAFMAAALWIMLLIAAWEYLF